MSGPYCETCEHYQVYATSKGCGECTDPAKQILISGNSVTIPPKVGPTHYCNQHKPVVPCSQPLIKP